MRFVLLATMLAGCYGGSTSALMESPDAGSWSVDGSYVEPTDPDAIAIDETTVEVPATPYPAEVPYLPADAVWFLKSEDRFRARPSFFRFFGSRLHYEEWSLGDPLTGVGFWGSLLIDMLNPAARKHRLR